jgi:hypothetical protein
LGDFRVESRVTIHDPEADGSNPLPALDPVRSASPSDGSNAEAEEAGDGSAGG